MPREFQSEEKAQIGSRIKRRNANQDAEEFFEKEGQINEPSEKMKIRLIPIWLRLVIVIILLCVSMIFGLMVGYGVIGDGNTFDVLKKSTWDHLVDLVLSKDA